MGHRITSVLSTFCCVCCDGDGFSNAALYQDWSSHPARTKYDIEGRLGEGGFSEVLLASDRKGQRNVALKVVFLNKAGLSSDQQRILASEAKFLRMLDHPNIIACHEVLRTQGQLVLVLDYLSGGELLDHLAASECYSEAQVAALFSQVAKAVAYMHNLNIMHRDIKPENVLLAKPAEHYTSKGKPPKVKLVDLGMAGVYRVWAKERGCMGSPGFMAPEIIRGEVHTVAMDIYALGVLLFVMLTGRKPYDHEQAVSLKYAKIAIAEAPGLKDARWAKVSPEAQQLVLHMLADRPADRPSAQKVLLHPWVVQQGGSKPKAVGDDVRLRLARLAERRRQAGHAQVVWVPHRGLKPQDYKAALKQAKRQLMGFNKTVSRLRIKEHSFVLAKLPQHQEQQQEQLQQEQLLEVGTIQPHIQQDKPVDSQQQQQQQPKHPLLQQQQPKQQLKAQRSSSSDTPLLQAAYKSHTKPLSINVKRNLSGPLLQFLSPGSLLRNRAFSASPTTLDVLAAQQRRTSCSDTDNGSMQPSTFYDTPIATSTQLTPTTSFQLAPDDPSTPLPAPLLSTPPDAPQYLALARSGSLQSQQAAPQRQRSALEAAGSWVQRHLLRSGSSRRGTFGEEPASRQRSSTELAGSYVHAPGSARLSCDLDMLPWLSDPRMSMDDRSFTNNGSSAAGAAGTAMAPPPLQAMPTFSKLQAFGSTVYTGGGTGHSLHAVLEAAAAGDTTQQLELRLEARKQSDDGSEPSPTAQAPAAEVTHAVNLVEEEQEQEQWAQEQEEQQKEDQEQQQQQQQQPPNQHLRHSSFGFPVKVHHHSPVTLSELAMPTHAESPESPYYISSAAYDELAESAPRASEHDSPWHFMPHSHAASGLLGDEIESPARSATPTLLLPNQEATPAATAAAVPLAAPGTMSSAISIPSHGVAGVEAVELGRRSAPIQIPRGHMNRQRNRY